MTKTILSCRNKSFELSKSTRDRPLLYRDTDNPDHYVVLYYYFTGHPGEIQLNIFPHLSHLNIFLKPLKYPLSFSEKNIVKREAVKEENECLKKEARVGCLFLNKIVFL